jgi:hypothetical protein
MSVPRAPERLQSVGQVGGHTVGGSGAFTAMAGNDTYAYFGPGQIMIREDGDASDARDPAAADLPDLMVVYAQARYGERPYWRALLSDRTLALMARRVRKEAATALSSQFGYFETSEYPFVWSETHALQNLMLSVDQFANANPPESPPSRELLADWWRDLVWTVAQVYADNVRQGLLYKQRLTEGPVNPGLVARPRVSDSAAGHRELNTAPYILSHPWGHNGNFPMR